MKDKLLLFDIQVVAAVPIQSCSAWELNGIIVVGGNGIGVGKNQLHRPVGLVIDRNTNDLYIVDTGNYRVQKYGSNTRVVTTILGHGQGQSLSQFIWPRGIHIDQHGNIYVMDAHRLMKFLPNEREGTITAGTGRKGSGLKEIQSGFDVYVDKHDNMYVSDYESHHVLKFKVNDTQGTLVAGVTNQPGNGSKQLNNPKGIYVYKNGDLLVSDSNNHRLQKFKAGQPEGITIAGTGQCDGGLRGLCVPDFVSVDDLENIYVSDGYNHRLQRFKSNSNTGETIAGGNIVLNMYFCSCKYHNEYGLSLLT